jgi:hypothetical protein
MMKPVKLSGRIRRSEVSDLIYREILAMETAIAEQAREIADWKRAAKLEASLADEARAALKAQPGLVVMPDVLFDGFTVYGEVLKGRKQQRTSHENVSDTLDAIVRLLRRANPDSDHLNATRVAISAAVNTLDDISRRSDARQLRMEALAPAPTVQPAHSNAVLIDRELFDGSEV